MSSLPEASSSAAESERAGVTEPEAAVEKAGVPDGLVPARELPSATDALAQLFAPEKAISELHGVRLGQTETISEEDSPADEEAGRGIQVENAVRTEVTESRTAEAEVVGIAKLARGEDEGTDLPPDAVIERADKRPVAVAASAEAQIPEAVNDTETSEILVSRDAEDAGKRHRRRGRHSFARLVIAVRSLLGGGRPQKPKLARQQPESSSLAESPTAGATSVITSEAALAGPIRAECAVGVNPISDASQKAAVEETGGVDSGLPEETPAFRENSAASRLAAGLATGHEELNVPARLTSASHTEETASQSQKLFSFGEKPAEDPYSESDRSSEEERFAASLLNATPAVEPSSEAQKEHKASYLDAVEVVESIEEDDAIASAIDRYANRTTADRSGDLDKGKLAADTSEKHENIHSLKAADEQVDINAVLEIPRDLEPAATVPVFDCEDLPAAAFADATASTEFAGAIGLANVPAHDLPEGGAPGSSSIPYRDWSFEEKLASHHEWIESKGKTGKKADLTGVDLEGSDLIGVDLRFVDLHDANLRAADLLMSDLRDACLVRANFRDSCLVGANLEAANLEGASLETAMGLVPRQLAGANLHEALLPASILQFESLAEFKRASQKVRGFFFAMMTISALSALLIWMTNDYQLLTNTAVFFFLHSQAAAAALPTVQFYLIAPVALFIFYLVFQFHLQHLWDLALELPAVFPDGRNLEENEPRIVVGLLRAHFRWMNTDAPSTRFVEKAISLFLAYWIVPIALFFYWVRFLTLQELRGTVLQELLVVAAAGVALYSTTRVGKTAERWTQQENLAERVMGKIKEINPLTTALVLLGVLTFLAAGTMLGVPHSKERAPQFMAPSIRRWATSVLWSFGIDPYADLTEAVISTKPPNWNGADEQVSAVKGARLNDANFRYAQAYRAFLANAHLLHANFQGAFLSQADLRGSDMGQSNLKYAVLDQALMSHVNLDRAVLDGANLSRADLRGANLSYASLGSATLVDAHLDGATLYGAKLLSATLIRTNFEKADLRESHLEGANLEHADMQGAYLWSGKLMGARLTNAELETAIFVNADLRNADVRWAHLSGTVLTGADLTGANLDGADFRGAVGFGANQICSAKSRHGLLLDDAMQSQVTAQCGAGN
jgi:uncharacterized protein YjbI with pentapeptide repeats